VEIITYYCGGSTMSHLESISPMRRRLQLGEEALLLMRSM